MQKCQLVARVIARQEADSDGCCKDSDETEDTDYDATYNGKDVTLSVIGASGNVYVEGMWYRRMLATSSRAQLRMSVLQAKGIVVP